MKTLRQLTILLFLTLQAFALLATGEASTYFQLFVPPNNDAVGRDVCLIVTAFYDSTEFQIIDDGADGDTDDTVTGMLMSGQSYVLFIRENGVNDDAPHRGESATKQDGDYFVVRSSNLVTTSMSTNSDWQHDWVPSTSKKGVGKRFFVYAPPTSNSPRDLNILTYTDSTQITISKITQTPLQGSGYTQIDYGKAEIVLQQQLQVGEDIIYATNGGKDLLQTGFTYLVESSEEIALQYGALAQNAKDGGGYVPARNGGSAGELFHFTVPFQSAREQEIRIVSWDQQNAISLDYYNGSNWINLQNVTLDSLQTNDWISTSGNKAHVFRVTCSPGKKVSVFEANWLETGSPGTSDIATTVSAENGTTAGKRFLAYMAPPGNEENVTNPLTGTKYTKGSHVYLFSRTGATVRVRDAFSMGQDYDSTYVIAPGRYADCVLDLAAWRAIYNGDGNPQSGPERPYLLIESNEPISVLNTNFNDNWMTYFGSPQPQSFKLLGNASQTTAAPGDTIKVNASITIDNANGLDSARWEILLGDGVIPIESYLSELTNGLFLQEDATFIPSSGTYSIVFDNLPKLESGRTYETTLCLVMSSNYVGGGKVEDRTVISVEQLVSGTESGFNEQASFTYTIINETSNTSGVTFSPISSGTSIANNNLNHWGVAAVDYDKDGWVDLFFPGYDIAEENVLYYNDQTGNFVSTNAAPITADNGSFVSSTWADIDNDGDLDAFVTGNIRSQSRLYRNDGRGRFTALGGGELSSLDSYAHNAAWADYDRDGLVDLFVTNYMPTGYNLLFHNDGNGQFSIEKRAAAILSESSQSIGAVWADYDRDGDADLFVPNTEEGQNSLYRNDGSGNFTRMDQSLPSLDYGNSIGASWGDYDNDGWQDLFVSNAANEANFFYRNNGDGTFAKIDTTSLTAERGNSTGSSWGDYNNDGWLDLFVSQDQGMPNRLFINDQQGDFRIDTLGPSTTGGYDDFAVANGDFDHDGDLDLAIAREGDDPDAVFYNNRGLGTNWISIYLEGTSSNLAAIGAEVRVKAVINGEVVWQTREISAQTGGGAGSQNEMMAHFGLGNAIGVDSVEIRWPSGYVQQLSGLSINNRHNLREPDGGSISGILFYDENKNCQQDSTEPGIPSMLIEVLPGPVYLQTDENGRYEGSLPPGTYSIRQVPNTIWLPTCTQVLNVQVQSVGQVITGLDLADTTSCTAPNLQVSLGSASPRQGFEGSVQLFYQNQGGGTATNTELTLRMDGEWVPASASTPWSSKTLENGRWVVRWDLDTLNAMEQGRIVLFDSVAASTTVGQQLDIELAIASSEADCQAQNNTQTASYEVFGAIDPNDLLAFPAGIGPEGFINAEQKITYRIRFQNIGNANAERVVIIDTLPENLDMATFTLLNTSHPATYSISKGGALVWTFDNINLPDSTRDEPGSHGFVEFSIMPQAEIAPGARILNTAHIRFDFAASIQTNTVLHTIWNESEPQAERSLWIGPNPMSTSARFWLGDGNGSTLGVKLRTMRIIDMQGRIWREENLDQKMEYQLEREQLQPGVYILSVTDEHGMRHATRLVIE
ncbi:MAG: FG-GAP-like repeat-containing protein [Bacteroidia bacterium]